MTKSMKAPISERALLLRINRKLKPDLEAVKKTRGGPRRFPIWAIITGSIIAETSMLNHHRILEPVGREMGVLKEWEMVQ